MRTIREIDVPPEYMVAINRACRLAWITIVFMISVTILMYLVMGSSQAMQTAWVEDLLTLIPPISFLVSARFRFKKPDHSFNYGYHRSVTIAYLSGSLALFTVGAILLIDNIFNLFSAEHPTVNTISIAGQTIWLGPLMILTLLYSAIPPLYLGYMKLEVAKVLHDKALYADAEMNKADWLTAGAAILGVTGIYYGYWWADAAAAIFISIEITRDGIRNVSNSVGDLMDRVPLSVEGKPLPDLEQKIIAELKKLDWIKRVDTRLREDGSFFLGEVFLSVYQKSAPANIPEQVMPQLKALDWRLQDLTVQVDTLIN